MIINRIYSQLRSRLLGALIILVVGNIAAAQSTRGARTAPAVRAFVQIDTPTVALTHVRVIDGTGAPARADQTIVIRDGVIAAVGAAASVQVPAGAQVIDLS